METGTNQKVGVVGLGLMGSALADALRAHHFELTVWNRSADKCRRFAEAGVAVADSVESLVSTSEVTIVCLSDHAVSMEVLGTAAVSQALSGKTLVLLSTMSPEESSSTAGWARDSRVAYLDGSILGYPANVRDQACMIVYSGPRAVFDICSPVLSAMGGMPRLVGEQAGTAPCFDKAIYSAYYARMIGLLHGAAMCEAAGAPLDVFIEATTDYWDWASEVPTFLGRVNNRDYSLAEAALEVHASAYKHVQQLSERLEISSKLPRVILDYLDSAVTLGYGNSELAAVFEVVSAGD